MLTETELVNRLRSLPHPTPPAGLLDDLRRDLRRQVHPPRDLRPSATGWRAFLRFPLSGWAAAAAVGTLVLFLVLSPGESRSFATAADSMRTVKSLHAVQYERIGAAHPVTRDASKPVNAWPNFSTSLHPANPLVRSDIYFRTHAQGYDQWLTIRGEERTWNQRNWELREDRRTGKRQFRLNSAPPRLETVVAPATDALRWKFVRLPNLAPAAPAAPGSDLAGCWTGESRFPGVAMGEHTPEWRLRLWLDETPGWIRRMEWWSDDYSSNAQPWMFQVLEFHQIDQPLTDIPFDLDLRESDLAPLGLSLDELSRLSASAFSAEITGSTNAPVRILIQEPGRQRERSGTLPLRLVHDPRDATEIRVEYTDGQARPVGAQVNGMNMATFGKALRIRVLPTGETEANSVN